MPRQGSGGIFTETRSRNPQQVTEPIHLFREGPALSSSCPFGSRPSRIDLQRSDTKFASPLHWKALRAYR